MTMWWGLIAFNFFVTLFACWVGYVGGYRRGYKKKEEELKTWGPFKNVNVGGYVSPYMYPPSVSGFTIPYSGSLGLSKGSRLKLK